MTPHHTHPESQSVPQVGHRGLGSAKTGSARLLNVIAHGLACDGWHTETLIPRGPVLRAAVFSAGRRIVLEVIARYVHHKSMGRPLPPRFSVRLPSHTRGHPADELCVTLPLVYWQQLGVIVALDPLSTGNKSPLARVGLETRLLIAAYERGVALQEGRGARGAVALLPGMLGHYIVNQGALHNLARSQSVAQAINSLMSQCEPLCRGAIAAATRAWGPAASGLLLALRAWRFRERVLSAYGHSCAVCGGRYQPLATPKLVPSGFRASSDETSNGIALCPNHHQAYDKALITITPDYQVVFSKARAQALAQADLQSGLDAFLAALRPIIVLPAEEQLRPRRDLLELGSTIRGWMG